MADVELGGNALLQSLVSPGDISVAGGVITAVFPRDDRMRYLSTHFVVKLDAGLLVLKGSATFFFDAGWATRDGKIVLDASGCSATKDSRRVTAPGPGATQRRTNRGVTPYTHNRTTLRSKFR